MSEGRYTPSTPDVFWMVEKYTSTPHALEGEGMGRTPICMGGV